MSVLRQIARNTSIIVASRVINVLITFGFIAYAARALGAQQFGQYFLIVTLVSFFSMVVNVGVAPVALREIARNVDGAAEWFSRFLALRLLLVGAAWAVLAGFLTLAGYEPEFNTLIYIMACTLLADSVNQSGSDLLTALDRVTTASLLQVAGTATISAFGVTALLGGHGVPGLLLASVCANFAMAGVWLLVTRRYLRVDSMWLSRAVLSALAEKVGPLAPIMIFNGLNRVLNVFLLSKIAGPVAANLAIGYYGPAFSVIRAPQNFLVAARRAVIPAVSQRLAQGHRIGAELAASLRAMILLFSLPFLVGTSFFSSEIIGLVFGSGYEESATVLTILGWALALRIAALTLEGFAVSSGRLNRLVSVAAWPFLLNLVLCAVLIPRYSYLGAAAALVASRALYLCLGIRYCRRFFGAHALGYRELGAMIAESALVYLACFVIAQVEIHVVVQLILSALTCGAALLHFVFRHRAGLAAATSR